MSLPEASQMELEREELELFYAHGLDLDAIIKLVLDKDVHVHYSKISYNYTEVEIVKAEMVDSKERTIFTGVLRRDDIMVLKSAIWVARVGGYYTQYMWNSVSP
jgi:hypothetical protein